MTVVGIDGITYGVDDLGGSRRFFLDWDCRSGRKTQTALNLKLSTAQP